MAFCKWIDNPIKAVASQSKALNYISNKKKTMNPEYGDKGQENAINYIVNEDKTRNFHFKQSLTEKEMNDIFLEHAFYVPGEDTSEEKEFFVTGFGCTKETAHSAMLKAHRASNKKAKNFAYHAVQSFKESPEEMTPQLAHKIGKQLVEELWADNYIVLMATHLNTDHCHNHFIICATSPYTGRKFPKGDKAMDDMKALSDKLCKEHQLHVIKSTERKYESIGEAKARKKGEPTYRELLRQDIDRAIVLAYSPKDFIKIMERFGYTFKFRGKNVTVIPKNRTRGIRLSEKLGYDYTYERICERIANKTLEQLAEQSEARRKPLPTIPNIKFKGSIANTKPTAKAGIKIEHYRFCYRMTIVAKPHSRRKRRRN